MNAFKRLRTARQDGFTIIELMFATAVFSLILIGATAAVIQVGRMYYKGVTEANTQNKTRNISDDIGRPIQFSGKVPNLAGTNHTVTGLAGVTAHSFCIGAERYSYVTGYALDTANSLADHTVKHVLWHDTMQDESSCNALDLGVDLPLDGKTVAGSGRELLDPAMRLTSFSVTNPAPRMYALRVWVVTGDEDVLECSRSDGSIVACNDPTVDRTRDTCQGGFLGARFCAVSHLDSVVTRRLK